MKENVFLHWKSLEERRLPAQFNTDADCADDIAFLANTPAQAESLMHKSGMGGK